MGGANTPPTPNLVLTLFLLSSSNGNLTLGDTLYLAVRLLRCVKLTLGDRAHQFTPVPVRLEKLLHVLTPLVSGRKKTTNRVMITIQPPKKRKTPYCMPG